MKRKNNKLLTLMLAGVLCAATAGTVAAALPVKASADTTAKSYELSKVFNSNGTLASITDKDSKTALTMSDKQSVEFNRNLAIQWYNAIGQENEGQAEYMTLKFTFGDLNFTEMDFTFDAIALHAAKDDIAVNTVKFISDGTTVSVKVLNGSQKSEDVVATATTITAENASFTLKLGAGSELGCYAVNLVVGSDSVQIGEFTNIGAKYFSNGSVNGKDTQALVVTTTAATDKQTVLYVDQINFQNFALTAGKIVDTAAPVLVVNEDIRGFLLGSQFELDYKEIDVLDDSLTSKKTFYQYNPIDEEIKLAENGIDYATTITPNSTTGTYFMDTIVYWNETTGEFAKEATEGYKKTTLFRALGEEYVSIRFTLEDDTFTGTGDDTHKKAAYNLAWYAENTKTVTVDSKDVECIVLNRTEDSPYYKSFTADDITGYEAKLQAKADKISAGSNADIELPSLEWLIADNSNPYSTLQFTISYKTPASSSAKTTSNVDPKGLKISVSDPGLYEFKVFASDVAGNAMYVDELDEDGNVKMTQKKDENNELVFDGNGDPVMVPKQVKVTAADIWDMDNIPSFTFTVASNGVKTQEGEDTDTLATKILGETYTMSSVEIVGAISEKSSYALYKLDISKYDGTGSLTVDTLSNIKFANLQTEMKSLIQAALADGAAVSSLDFKEINKQAYINLVARAIGGEVDKVAKIFVLDIDEFNGDIEEGTEDWDNSHNKYEWNPSSVSFTAAESGLYIIVADYWDGELLYVDHAPAYQLIEVESEADVIKGETEWLKNNLVSVILFSVAAVMLILIIILLLVKPSDETLEDVDEKIISKRKEATDKHKKN